MSYGMIINDSSGNPIYTMSDSTYTLLAYYTSPANTSVTHTGVPTNMGTRIVVRQIVGEITGDNEAYAHTYSLSGSSLVTSVPLANNTMETFFMVFGK